MSKKKKKKKKLNKKQNKKVFIKRPTQEIEQFAAKLRSKTVKSESWFIENTAFLKIHDELERNTVFFSSFIPDFVNHKRKYVIEVDGLIHFSKKMRKKDKYKDEFYTSKGYSVIRVEAYSFSSLYKAIVKLRELHDISVKKIIRRDENGNEYVHYFDPLKQNQTNNVDSPTSL